MFLKKTYNINGDWQWEPVDCRLAGETCHLHGGPYGVSVFLADQFGRIYFHLSGSFPTTVCGHAYGRVRQWVSFGCRLTVELARKEKVRQKRWTEWIAVGGKDFVEGIRGRLGMRARPQMDQPQGEHRVRTKRANALQYRFSPKK